MKTRRAFLKKTASGSIAGIIASGAAPAFVKAATAPKKNISMEQAKEVHDKCLIIDGHNDTPVRRVARKEDPLTWMQRDMYYHTDVPRMKEGGYDAGFMIVGNGPTANVWETTERTIAQIEKYPDDLMMALTSDDVLRAQKTGKIGCILSIEGAARWVVGRVDLLKIYYRLGVRLMGITHGEGGEDPAMLQGTKSLYRICTMAEREDDRKNGIGLTPFGMEILKASNKLGIVTDLSHINDKAFYDVLEHSSTPPIMSHSAVYELCPHARCMTDDQIRALADKGGVMGIAFAPQFIDTDREKATIGRFVEHILHVRDLVGIDYVAIGTDYDGLGEDTIPIIPEVSQLPRLTQSMLAYGMTEKEIRKVWGGNFLRILKKTID